MRARSLTLIAAIFGAAALASLLVVTQMPREGEVSAPRRAAPAPQAPQARSPDVERAFGAADGEIELHVAAGGEPQGGAEVRLYLAPAEPGAPWRRAGEARTGSDGVARLFAAPGAYLAVARAEGLAPGRAEVVRSTAEEVGWAELALEPAAVLAGRTVALDGGPIAGARIRALPIVSRWPGLAAPSAPPEETATAETDGEGRFRLEGLAPGCWAVAIEAAGHHPVELARVAVPGDALAVALEPLGSVEGIVLLPDGRPAAGAAVTATAAEHGASARAGPDGRFTLAAPAGSYRVQAALGDRASTAPVPIVLAAGATARGAEIRLGPAAALEARVAALATGAPIAGAHVAVHPHESREEVARAVTGPDGRVRIAGLAPGSYDVRAAAAGWSPILLAGVTLSPGGRFPLRLALPGTGAVEGTVRDAAGAPLAGARVRIVTRSAVAPGAPLETRSDFEGRFRVEGVEVGRAEVIARQEGVVLGVSRAVRIADGRTAKVDPILPEPGILTGGVGLAGRPPPPGTTVIALAMGAGPGAPQVARAVTDPGGRYELVLPAGEYRVHAAPGHVARTDLRVAPAYARVEPRRTARLDLVLADAEPEGGPEVLVLEPGGAPSPGAEVTLARPDDARVAIATSAGEDGRVAIGARMGMAGRAVTIRARNGGRAGAETLTLPATGTVVVRLRPGGAVEGVVRGRAPVSGFTLEVASRPAAVGWRTVDVHRFAGDRFRLGDLPPEPLRLVVRADDGRRGQAELRLGSGETRTVQIALGP